MTTTRILLIIAVIILIILFTQFFYKDEETGPITRRPSSAVVPMQQNYSILGCYVAKLGNDVYTLNLQSEVQGTVTGNLAFTNFEKDSSRGTFTGKFNSGILFGEYAFTSEGTNSIREVIFKKTNDGFVEGFGPMSVEEGKERFTDVAQVTYESSPVFKTTSCETAIQKQ